MASHQATQIGVQSVAVVSGSFLSGAMMGLSIIAVPVMLRTNTQAAGLLAQFVQLYDLGHKIMPSLAVSTFLLHGFTAFSKYNAGLPWHIHLIAGITTLGMVPFTWITMTPTNYKLFGFFEKSNAKEDVSVRTIKDLVVKWAWLHVARSLFPLAGAIIAGITILRQLQL